MACDHKSMTAPTGAPDIAADLPSPDGFDATGPCPAPVGPPDSGADERIGADHATAMAEGGPVAYVVEPSCPGRGGGKPAAPQRAGSDGHCGEPPSRQGRPARPHAPRHRAARGGASGRGRTVAADGPVAARHGCPDVVGLRRRAMPLGPAVLAVTALLACAAAAAAEPRFHNPLLPSGPDPWIVRDGGTYYYMNTLGNRLAIRATRDLTRLAQAPETTVWTPPATGPNAQSIWAPELHRIDGKWFIYYSAAESGHDDDAHRGIFVLENAGRDPTRGRWIDRGRLATAHHGIDGTTFSYRGKRYFAYSPYIGPDSDIAIVRMTNPWTLTGPETVIARPDLAWERQGGRQILEGPEFLRGPGGDLFLTYSASACWSDDYAIGLLSAAPGSDPLDAAAWHKNPRPVIAKAPDQMVYAPGHNGFFTSPDGRETWIVYHANPGPGMGCTARRSPRIQQVTWSAAGQPLFAPPLGTGAELAAPGAGGAVAPDRRPR